MGVADRDAAIIHWNCSWDCYLIADDQRINIIKITCLTCLQDHRSLFTGCSYPLAKGWALWGFRSFCTFAHENTSRKGR